MDWSDEGIVLGVRRHGESSVILEAMTRHHGRHLGVVRGGRSPRQAAILQPGNALALSWRARLEEHLGHYQIEARSLDAGGFLDSALALNGLATLAGHLRLLPERDPHPSLYDALAVLIGHLAEPPQASALMARLEMALLAELGFGLDLTCCAATGATDDLRYVSPKSGRAVSAGAGAPWADRLLELPGFLTPSGRGIALSRAAMRAGFSLTGYFLDRHVYAPRGLPKPDARDRFVALALTALPDT